MIGWATSFQWKPYLSLFFPPALIKLVRGFLFGICDFLAICKLTTKKTTKDTYMHLMAYFIGACHKQGRGAGCNCKNTNVKHKLARQRLNTTISKKHHLRFVKNTDRPILICERHNTCAHTYIDLVQTHLLNDKSTVGRRWFHAALFHCTLLIITCILFLNKFNYEKD